MNRIDRKFNALKSIGKKALITFITAGDPDIDMTGKLVKEMVNKGADIIELGIPYSDPIAEGPVIQRANGRALKNEIKIDHIIKSVKGLRDEGIDNPVIFLLYYNCIFKYGRDRFFKEIKNAGVDGVIVPDLPYEEKGEISDSADINDIYVISLITPVSHDRIIRISEKAKGFLYCVSSLGVTGIRDNFDTDFTDFFTLVNKNVNIPTAIGFGISKPEHVQRLKDYSDGLIIGSAIVKIIEESNSEYDTIKNVGNFVMAMRNEIDK